MALSRREAIAHQEAQLATHTRNLRLLEEQIATYGGAMGAPLALLNQRDAARQAIADATAELEQLRAVPVAEQSPYLGLSAFQEQDAPFFFGRDALIDQLVAKVRA